MIKSPSARGIVSMYRDLWRYASSRQWLLACAFVLLLGSQAFRLAIPWLSAQAINTVQARGSAGLAEAASWLAWVFAATLAGWLLHGPGRIMERNVALSVRRRLSNEMLTHLFSLPLAWHDRHHSGDTVHRLRQCTGALYDFAQSQFIYLQNAARLFGPVLALTLISGWVGLAAAIGLVSIGAVIVVFDRRMIELATGENAAERAYQSTQLDALGNIGSVFALRLGPALVRLVDRRLADVEQPLRRSISLNEWKWCSVDLLGTAQALALVALYAGLSMTGGASADAASGVAVAGAGSLAIGNLFMVYEYAAQAGGVITSIAAHFQSLARQKADYASGDPIRQAVAQPSVDPALLPASAWTGMQIDGLHFMHPRATGLSIATLRLSRARRYALVGPSGSGKSTLLRVLGGLYRSDRLVLRVDDAPVPIDDPQIAAAWLREIATLIPQDSELFEGSVADNLRMPLGHDHLASEDDLRDALRIARADEFLAGVDLASATIAERGANWSGGQRQRLALARGVLAGRGCSLLLLDEPSAALDADTEAIIHQRLFTRFEHCCIVSSVHRMHLLDRFDAVILMRDGMIQDQGTVAELAERSEWFRSALGRSHEGEH